LIRERVMEFWKDFEITVGDLYRWDIGPLTIWMRLTSFEWWISTEESDDGRAPAICEKVDEEPEGLEWRRWARHSDSQRVKLTPIMPDRSVVVRPETSVFFPPGTDGMLYARLPVWVKISVVGDGEQDVALCEIPSSTLSNTWFGENTVEGELCYAMHTTARRSLEGVEDSPNRVICPLRLHNRSDDVLNFERLAIGSQHLTIYEYEGHLWTSCISVTYRGTERLSVVKHEENWFERPETATVLCPPRTPKSGKRFKKTFGGIMHFVRAG
jgi:hypothetical protein